jgi:TonB-linked SusC/RagA family outer membrane protein
MQVSAASFGQLITLNEKNAQLEQVFREIRRQSGYNFYYDGKAVAPDYRVSVSVRNATVEETLKTALKDFPLSFEINENGVTIKRTGTVRSEDQIENPLKLINVKGRVTDEGGKPLPGATVKLKGSGLSQSAGLTGDFSFAGVEEKEILIVSYTGYVSREIRVTNEPMEIKLELSNSKLDEVQVMAYGTTTRRTSTGTIATVKAEDIEKQPVSNVLEALQGRIPGLIINAQSGNVGSGYSVQLRGRNSLNFQGNPLIVVDGVPYPDVMLPGTPSILGEGSPLNFLNVNGIESVDVLKDADATAIYGSRGANGVILITTKKGSIGETRFNVNVSQGISKVLNRVEMMDTKQYLQMRREAFKNSGRTPSADPTNIGYARDLMVWDTTRYTDWQKVLIGNTAQYADYNLSASGGNSFSQFNISGFYKRQTDVFIGDGNDRKTGLNLSLNLQSPNNKFRLLFSGSFMNDVNSASAFDFANSFVLSPNAPALYKADGTLNWENSTWNNPLALLNNKFKRNAKNLVANTIVSYAIIPGLDFKSSLGYTNLSSNDIATYPVTGLNPTRWATATRSAQYADNNISTWIVEPQLQYSKMFNDLKIEVLLGSSLQENKGDGKVLNAYGFSSDALLESIDSAPFVEATSNTVSTYRYIAGFGRATLNYANRFLFNLSGRRDGSTRFGPDKRFANFYSVGAGWIMSEEGFFKRSLPFVSFAKLRGSFGSTGSDAIPDYHYMDLYESIGLPYGGVQGLATNKLFNNTLAWETTHKLEIGLDLGFWKDRLLFNANYFRNRSSNQLMNYGLPGTTGYDGILTNRDAKIQNSGFEFTLSSQNLKGRNFSWKTELNLSAQRNKLLAYPGLEGSTYANTLIVGEPLSIGRVFRFAGINPTTGLYEFYTASGSKTSTPDGINDKTGTVNLTPEFFGGMNNVLRYKEFELSFFFQFVRQKGGFFYDLRPGAMSNLPAVYTDRWHSPGSMGAYQRVDVALNESTDAFSAVQQSDYNVTDASYIKLRNVSLSYSLPAARAAKYKIGGASVFLRTQNLLTITNYKGSDPETQNYFTIPPVFTLLAGLSLTF